MIFGLTCNCNQTSLPYKNKCKMLHFQIVCMITPTNIDCRGGLFPEQGHLAFLELNMAGNSLNW